MPRSEISAFESRKARNPLLYLVPVYQVRIYKSSAYILVVGEGDRERELSRSRVEKSRRHMLPNARRLVGNRVACFEVLAYLSPHKLLSLTTVTVFLG